VRRECDNAVEDHHRHCVTAITKADTTAVLSAGRAHLAMC
jgi:hypothetical protein